MYQNKQLTHMKPSIIVVGSSNNDMVVKADHFAQRH
jgi:hypothetical protein